MLIEQPEGGSGTLTAAYGHIQTAVPTIGHENRHIGHEIQNARSSSSRLCVKKARVCSHCETGPRSLGSGHAARRLA